MIKNMNNLYGVSNMSKTPRNKKDFIYIYKKKQQLLLNGPIRL